MKKSIRLFATVMVCMAMALCVSCKKDNAEPSGGGTGGGNTGGGGGGTGSHEYVDLGLPSGLLWATCNVGADSPEDYGDYFAWGETETKSFYDWSTYKWCNGSGNTLTKYCTDSHYGTVDNKTVLELADDAARANWGGDWRMPTVDEMYELIDNCTWTWMTLNGVSGRLVEGPNGNSIFMPAAGGYVEDSLQEANSYGVYWSSSLNTDGDPAYFLAFLSNIIVQTNSYKSSRCIGQSVRPVYGTHAPIVTTSSILDIAQTSATCVGNVTGDGGAMVTARGVCWSTSQNPTLNNNHTTNGAGTGSFTSGITGLTANTTYYVRAYATNSAGTSYGEQKSFTTQSGGGSIGCIGCFSVSYTTTVEFAQGNLWYGIADGESTPAFHFEANQWDYSVVEGSGPYYNWNPIHVSHFLWSNTTDWQTSGKEPYAASYSYSNQTTSDVFFTNATKTTANPSFQVSGETAGTWRTLSDVEWNYLLNTRDNASNLRACKELDAGTHEGLVILPDGTDASVMSSITMTADLATHGAVFLPTAGYRDGTIVFGGEGCYWSSTPCPDDGYYEGYAYYMHFFWDDAGTISDRRSRGNPVRLVR